MLNPRLNDPTPGAASTASPQRAAVPISVYRQLAAELEQAKTELAAIQHQNQQLLHHNQRLRQAFETLTAALQAGQRLSRDYDDTGQTRSPQAAAPETAAPPFSVPEPELDRDHLVSELQAAPQRPHSPLSSSDASGWLLGIAIALIAFTTFGVAFLTVRPLLTNQGND